MHTGKMIDQDKRIMIFGCSTMPKMKKNIFWIKKETFQMENSETYLL